MIDFNHFSFSYDKNTNQNRKIVLDQLNIHIDSGENVGIIGCNGVGKSTLLKLLVGIEETENQGLYVLGYEMNRQNIRKIREKAGYIFQDSDSQLFMNTVYEDVAFGPENEGLTSDQVQQKVNYALQQVHIEHLAEKKVYQLSGGEKKLAAIATVLSMEPQVLLMDEPSAALDPGNRRNLIRVLNEISMTKVIASHDLDFIYDTCERTILLYHGRIAADGDTKKILTDQPLLESCGLELPLSFSR